MILKVILITLTIVYVACDKNFCGLKEEDVYKNMRPSCCIQKFRASGSMSHSNGDVGINCDQIRKQNLQKCDSFIQTESKCESQPVQATPSHTFCPGIGDKAVIYSSEEELNPKLECKRCDLTVNKEQTAVTLHCFDCQDIPEPEEDRAACLEK